MSKEVGLVSSMKSNRILAWSPVGSVSASRIR
jgi:hypothetical protein